MRRSISHTGMVQPGGPSSQRRTSSGLVNASNTKERGASKSRDTWISRSLGMWILKLSGKCTEPPLPQLGSRAFSLLAGGFQFTQQAVEAYEGCFPILAICLQPLGSFREGPSVELARSSLRIAGGGNRSCAFEHPEMSRYRRLSHREGLGEFIHRDLSRRQARQNCPPGWISQSSERHVQSVGHCVSIT